MKDYEVTAWKVSKYGVFSGPYFPVFGLNTGKYGTEKTAYLDTFHAVVETLWKDMQTNLVTDLVYGVTMGQTVFLADMSINKNDVTNELTSLPNVTSNTKQI